MYTYIQYTYIHPYKKIDRSPAKLTKVPGLAQLTAAKVTTAATVATAATANPGPTCRPRAPDTAGPGQT